MTGVIEPLPKESALLVVVVVMVVGVVLELTKVFNYRHPQFQCFRYTHTK